MLSYVKRLWSNLNILRSIRFTFLRHSKHHCSALFFVPFFLWTFLYGIRTGSTSTGTLSHLCKPVSPSLSTSCGEATSSEASEKGLQWIVTISKKDILNEGVRLSIISLVSRWSHADWMIKPMSELQNATLQYFLTRFDRTHRTYPHDPTIALLTIIAEHVYATIRQTYE